MPRLTASPASTASFDVRPDAGRDHDQVALEPRRHRRNASAFDMPVAEQRGRARREMRDAAPSARAAAEAPRLRPDRAALPSDAASDGRRVSRGPSSAGRARPRGPAGRRRSPRPGARSPRSVMMRSQSSSVRNTKTPSLNAPSSPRTFSSGRNQRAAAGGDDERVVVLRQPAGRSDPPGLQIDRFDAVRPREASRRWRRTTTSD